ncbi:MAG: hypothetical protein E6L04_10325 [Thaumarchaeota archaeon]|nr:MAG: hypothetical protein E6L04_10325 [Nitrososphaerota archaeon]
MIYTNYVSYLAVRLHNSDFSKPPCSGALLSFGKSDIIKTARNQSQIHDFGRMCLKIEGKLNYNTVNEKLYYAINSGIAIILHVSLSEFNDMHP